MGEIKLSNFLESSTDAKESDNEVMRSVCRQKSMHRANSLILMCARNVIVLCGCITAVKSLILINVCVSGTQFDDFDTCLGSNHRC